MNDNANYSDLSEISLDNFSSMDINENSCMISFWGVVCNQDFMINFTNEVIFCPKDLIRACNIL